MCASHPFPEGGASRRDELACGARLLRPGASLHSRRTIDLASGDQRVELRSGGELELRSAGRIEERREAFRRCLKNQRIDPVTHVGAESLGA